MTSESTISPAIPPPQEESSDHQPPLPQNPVNSDNISAVPPSPPKLSMEVTVNSNGVVTEKMVNEIEEPSYYKYLDSREYADKFQRYEADFKQYLMSQYFSGKDPNGVDVFEETTIIDGETIMSSKWPCTRVYAEVDVSYVEPVQCPVEEGEDDEEEEEEEESVDSATAEILPSKISNGGTVSEKISS